MGSGYFNVQKKEVLVMGSETKEFVQLVRLYAVKEKELPYGKKELNDSAKVVELSRQILKNQDREYILAIAMDARTKPVLRYLGRLWWDMCVKMKSGLWRDCRYGF